MPHEVIMPALGMAQDSGLIVAWHKSPGDSVDEGDVLFEVETDKATMEVEAQGSGFLTDVSAQAGESVPVGQTIALISETSRDSGIDSVAQKATARDMSEPNKDVSPIPEPPRPGKVPSRAVAVGAGAGGRILASPKARRLALELGLDLRQMLNSGLSQPFHARDVLEHSGRSQGSVAHPNITAMVSGGDFMEILDRLSPEGDGITAGEFAAVLASGAARVAGFGDRIAISLERLGESPLMLLDPDIPWSKPADQQVPQAPVIVLRDLTGTRLTAVHQCATVTPTLTLSSGGGSFSVRLDYVQGALDDESALALISGFAERLDSPLRQLL